MMLQRAPCGVAAARRTPLYAAAEKSPARTGLVPCRLTAPCHWHVAYSDWVVSGPATRHPGHVPGPRHITYVSLPCAASKPAVLPRAGKPWGKPMPLPRSVLVCSPLEGDAQATLASLCGDHQKTLPPQTHNPVDNIDLFLGTHSTTPCQARAVWSRVNASPRYQTAYRVGTGTQ